MTKIPELTEMTKQELLKIEKDTGESISLIEDFHDVYELNQYSVNMKIPDLIGDRVALLDMPVKVGDAFLYRINFAGLFWLQDYGSEFFSDNELLTVLSLGYVMAEGRNKDCFKGMDSRAGAKKKIKRWARQNNIGVKQLVAVVADTFNFDGNVTEVTEADYGSVLDILSKERNADPSFWLWEISLDTLTTLLEAGSRKNAEMMEEAEKGVKGKGVKRKAPDPNSPRIQALWRFKQLSNKIKQRKLCQKTSKSESA